MLAEAIDIGNLDLNVDITVSGPEDYIDNAPPTLPMGTYDFSLVDFDLDKDQTGAIRKTRAGHPILLVKAAKVASEGPHQNRIVRNQRIYFTPFPRKRADGTTATASGVGDFLRALDRTFSFTSLDDVLSFLQRCKDEGTTFRARWNWEAYDKEYYEAQRILKGIAENTPEAKQLRKAATLSGKKGFPNGPAAEGPSGRMLEAQGRFGDFYAKRVG